MPLYEYRCADNHTTERLRKYPERDDPSTCFCGLDAPRIVSASHAPPDGIYSYAPNLGSEAAFERKRDAIRNGVTSYRKPADD